MMHYWYYEQNSDLPVVIEAVTASQANEIALKHFDPWALKCEKNIGEEFPTNSLGQRIVTYVESKKDATVIVYTYDGDKFWAV